MRKKKIFLLIFLALGFGTAGAQRFFYVDGNPVTENFLKGGLANASQHISVSPLSSDYIIKADVGFQTGANVLTLQINLQDTATLQTIFQNKEIYTFRELPTKSRLFLRTVIRAFIERNIPLIVQSAGEKHGCDQMSSLRARKDKT